MLPLPSTAHATDDTRHGGETRNKRLVTVLSGPHAAAWLSAASVPDTKPMRAEPGGGIVDTGVDVTDGATLSVAAQRKFDRLPVCAPQHHQRNSKSTEL